MQFSLVISNVPILMFITSYLVSQFIIITFFVTSPKRMIYIQFKGATMSIDISAYNSVEDSLPLISVSSRNISSSLLQSYFQVDINKIVLYGPSQRQPISFTLPLLNQGVGNNATLIMHLRYSIFIEYEDVSFHTRFISGQRVIQLLSSIVYVWFEHRLSVIPQNILHQSDLSSFSLYTPDGKELNLNTVIGDDGFGDIESLRLTSTDCIEDSSCDSSYEDTTAITTAITSPTVQLDCLMTILQPHNFPITADLHSMKTRYLMVYITLCSFNSSCYLEKRIPHPYLTSLRSHILPILIKFWTNLCYYHPFLLDLIHFSVCLSVCHFTFLSKISQHVF